VFPTGFPTVAPNRFQNFPFISRRKYPSQHCRHLPIAFADGVLSIDSPIRELLHEGEAAVSGRIDVLESPELARALYLTKLRYEARASI
jgi:hypothetical protein